MRVTPSTIDPNTLIGLQAYAGASTMPGITQLQVFDQSNTQGYDFEKMADMTEVSFPRLSSTGPSADIYITDSPNLVTVNFPVLSTPGKQPHISDNPSLTTINMPAFNAPGVGLDFRNNALSQANVDAILAMLVAIPTYGNSGESVNLGGGTSATPSAGGLTDKATLIARGASVTTN